MDNYTFIFGAFYFTGTTEITFIFGSLFPGIVGAGGGPATAVQDVIGGIIPFAR